MSQDVSNLVTDTRIDIGTLYVHIMHCILCPKCGPFEHPYFSIYVPICSDYAHDISLNNATFHLHTLKLGLKRLKLIGFPEQMESPCFLFDRELRNRYKSISRIINTPIITLPYPRPFPIAKPNTQSSPISIRTYQDMINFKIPETEKFYLFNIKEHVDKCEYCKGKSNLKCPFSLLIARQTTVNLYDLIKIAIPPENIIQLVNELSSPKDPTRRIKRSVTLNLPLSSPQPSSSNSPPSPLQPIRNFFDVIFGQNN